MGLVLGASAACGGGEADGDSTVDVDVDAEPMGLRVDAGPDQTLIEPVDQITLMAVIAGDDGAATTTAWTQTGGASATLSGTDTTALTASGLTVGDYAFHVEVTTADASASDDVSVTVLSNTTLCDGATFHISPTGNDATGDGSEAAPWKTLFHATATATTFGSTIHVAAGTYLETEVSELAAGVCLEGEGTSSVIMSTVTTDWKPIVHAWSPEGTDGHQHISHLKFDGQNLSSFWGIEVAGRSNVSIHDVTVVDFLDRGVIMTGRDDNQGLPPTTWATGLSFYNNTILNSAAYDTPLGVYGRGCLNIGGTEGMRVYNNVITQDQRPLGYNGWPIKGTNEGFNRGLKLYDNVLTKIPYHGGGGGDGGWDFAVEMFSDEGSEVYNNQFIGGAFDTNPQAKGAYPYSLWIHDNTFTMPTPQASNNDGIILEFSSDTVIVERNVIDQMSNCIIFTPRVGDTISNVVIANNLCSNVGKNTGDFTNAGFIHLGPGGTDYNVDDLRIYNNTFLADPNNRPWWGIELGGPTAGSMHNIQIINNILGNVVSGAIVQGSGGGVVLDGGIIRNNLIFAVEATTEPVWTGTPPTNTIVEDNIHDAPVFEGDAYQLAPGSPGIDAGYDVGIPFTGSAPDIGYAES